jgi:hypothetical protein
MYRRSAEKPDAAASGQQPDSGAPQLLNRRRLAILFGGLVALWLVGVFARQVGDAAAAANQADLMRARNVAMARDIASLETELTLIQKPAFVAEMARGYLLGSPVEIPFSVNKAGSPLPSDAPGSEGIRPGGAAAAPSPFESWLEALFGSGT